MNKLCERLVALNNEVRYEGYTAAASEEFERLIAETKNNWLIVVPRICWKKNEMDL